MSTKTSIEVSYFTAKKHGGSIISNNWNWLQLWEMVISLTEANHRFQRDSPQYQFVTLSSTLIYLQHKSLRSPPVFHYCNGYKWEDTCLIGAKRVFIKLRSPRTELSRTNEYHNNSIVLPWTKESLFLWRGWPGVKSPSCLEHGHYGMTIHSRRNTPS